MHRDYHGAHREEKDILEYFTTEKKENTEKKMNYKHNKEKLMLKKFTAESVRPTR